MQVQEIFELISFYGFPMVLSIYLLLRFETLIRELKDSVDTLVFLSDGSSKKD